MTIMTIMTIMNDYNDYNDYRCGLYMTIVYLSIQVITMFTDE